MTWVHLTKADFALLVDRAKTLAVIFKVDTDFIVNGQNDVIVIFD